MTPQENYKLANTWQSKVLIMNLYHTAAILVIKSWTLRDTATYFDVSIGLVSENIRLANAIDTGVDITSCKTRQEALTKLEKRRYVP